MSDEVNNGNNAPRDREPEIQNFKCPNCGGIMKWNIKKRGFMCSSCGTPGELDTDNKKVLEHPLSQYQKREDELTGASVTSTSDNSDAENAPSNVRRVIYCKTCGSQIEFEANQTAAVCPMCGSSQVDAKSQAFGIPPDGVVPFMIDEDDAKARFKQWVRHRWFAPSKLKLAYQTGKLTPVYIPIWTYDLDVTATYTGMGGRIVSVRDGKGNIRSQTNWFPVSGTVSERLDDVPVFAGTDKNAKTLSGILPFNTQEGSYPYSPAFLSGVNSERYAFSAVEGFKRVKNQVDAELKARAQNSIIARGFNTATVSRVNADYGDPCYKQILAPVWISNFVYNKKNYTYAINGDTGNICGERPYSPLKIAVAVLIAAVAVALFLIWDMSTLNNGSESQEPSSGYYEYYNDYDNYGGYDNYYNNYNSGGSYYDYPDLSGGEITQN